MSKESDSIALSKKYISLLDEKNWPTENIRINAIHILELWSDKDYNWAAVKDVYSKHNWTLLHRSPIHVSI